MCIRERSGLWGRCWQRGKGRGGGGRTDNERLRRENGTHIQGMHAKMRRLCACRQNGIAVEQVDRFFRKNTVVHFQRSTEMGGVQGFTASLPYFQHCTNLCVCACVCVCVYVFVCVNLTARSHDTKQTFTTHSTWHLSHTQRDMYHNTTLMTNNIAFKLISITVIANNTSNTAINTNKSYSIHTTNFQCKTTHIWYTLHSR